MACIDGPYMLESSSSAISRVPAEIWAEIFVFAQMMYSYNKYGRLVLGLPTHTTLPHPRQLPWNVSYVCSLWRETAVSHSRLWSSYPIVLEDQCLSLKDPVALLRLVLARSPRPRRIHFFQLSGIFIDFPLVHTLLKMLIDHSTVWESLRIQMHPSFADLLSRLHGKLPLLERLSIDWYHKKTPKIEGFEVCPRLVKLTLDGEGAFETTSQFPWSQLTDFVDTRSLVDGEAPTDSGYYTEIVAAAPNLRRLETKCVPLQESNSRVHHNKLKEISLSDVSLLSCFALPSLEKLTMGASQTHPDDITSSISAFIAESRNCSHLTSLSVTDTVPDADFDLVLAALPQLTRLELTFEEWDERTLEMTEEFFVELTTCVDGDAVLRDFDLIPSLQHLFVWFNPCRDTEAPSNATRIVTGAPLREMLDKRYQRSPLKSFVLGFSADSIEVPEEVASYYRGMKNRGLRIQICATLLESTRTTHVEIF